MVSHLRPLKAVNLVTMIHEALEMARGTLEERSALLDGPAKVELRLPALPPINRDLGIPTFQKVVYPLPFS